LVALTGLSPEEITDLTGIKEKYRSRQIVEWLKRGAASFEEMTNLPASLRQRLAESFEIFSSRIEASETDDEGTAKLVIRLHDGHLIEAVRLKDDHNRTTICLSSQAGCAMGCSFCRTGMMGLLRNLTSGEIIEQYMHIKNLYGDIDNIVYMGMGEPFNNIDEVLKSLRFFTGEDGLNLSARRITVSTCGIIDGIRRFTEESSTVRLAVSLVSASTDIRTMLMPVTRNNSLSDLKKALLNYQNCGGRRITLECTLIKGINDSVKDAALIAEWSKGLRINVNVIPWNPASEIAYSEPEPRQLDAFCRELDRKEVPFTRRYRRGRGLNAACGQLATNLKKHNNL
jgi:23S rRNA (adenine2503-C2)-methyltransferase